MTKLARREEVSVWCGTRRFLERQKGKKQKHCLSARVAVLQDEHK